MTDPGTWPRWASEIVEIHPPDPRWSARGRAEAAGLDVLLAPWLTAPSEHVGSTAIPGLPAKPIIDLQAALADHTAVPETLAAHGWHLVSPDLDGKPWRRFLVRVVADRRAAHLHLMTAGSSRLREQIAFRDALRADPALRDEYADLKYGLAVRHADDREAYTRGKAGFVRRVLSAGR